MTSRIGVSVRGLDRDHEHELSPIDIPAMADGRFQLFCKSGDDTHAQSSALAEVKAGRQSDAVVAHRYERSVLVLSG